MQDVYSFKLQSGEEIIAKVVQKPIDGDVQDYVINSPWVIMVMEVAESNGKSRVMPLPAAPWILLARDGADVELKERFIMNVEKNVPKPVEDTYLQTLSPIVMG